MSTIRLTKNNDLQEFKRATIAAFPESRIFPLWSIYPTNEEDCPIETNSDLETNLDVSDSEEELEITVKLEGKAEEKGESNLKKEEAKEGSKVPPESRTLYIGGLTQKTTDESLKQAMHVFGDVSALCEVKRDRKTGESRGFAFVTYKTLEGFHKALKDPNKDIDGYPVTCKPSNRKPRVTSKPRKKKETSHSGKVRSPYAERNMAQTRNRPLPRTKNYSRVLII